MDEDEKDWLRTKPKRFIQIFEAIARERISACVWVDCFWNVRKSFAYMRNANKMGFACVWNLSLHACETRAHANWIHEACGLIVFETCSCEWHAYRHLPLQFNFVIFACESHASKEWLHASCTLAKNGLKWLIYIQIIHSKWRTICRKIKLYQFIIAIKWLV